MKPSKGEWFALVLTGTVFLLFTLYFFLTLPPTSTYTISGSQTQWTAPSSPSPSPSPEAPAGLVDINTAGLDELSTLSGIGPVKAQAILDHRAANGPFTAPEELMDVYGIGPATYKKLASEITLSTP